MLKAPRGYEFWMEDEHGKTSISSEAPEWAKEEFKRYQEQVEIAEKPDEQGNINQI